MEPGWAAFVDKVGKDLPPMPPEVVEGGNRWLRNWDTIIERYDDVPNTVTHSDFHLGNMLFDARGGERPLVVIDWQLMMRRNGLGDVAYFLAGNMDTQQRRDGEPVLLAHYHAELLEGGVQCSLEDGQRWYRMGVLGLYSFMCVNQDQMSRGDLDADKQALLDIMFERHGHALLDTGALDEIPG